MVSGLPRDQGVNNETVRICGSLGEKGVNLFGKERCRNCGKPTKKSEMRGKNCRKCDNEINRPNNIPGTSGELKR